MSGHGHVTPNLDGSRARCGGPGICSVCAQELASTKQVYNIDTINKAFQEKIMIETEIRAEAWLKAAMGTDWTEKFKEAQLKIIEQREQLTQSKAANAKLRAALEFYASTTRWEWTTNESTYDGIGCSDFETFKSRALGPSQVGGKTARNALSSDPSGQDLLDAIHFVLHELGAAETAQEIGVAKTFIRSALAALKKAMGDE